jgi:hypothetical protein
MATLPSGPFMHRGDDGGARDDAGVEGQSLLAIALEHQEGGSGGDHGFSSGRAASVTADRLSRIMDQPAALRSA